MVFRPQLPGVRDKVLIMDGQAEINIVEGY